MDIHITEEQVRGELKRLPLLILGTLLAAFSFAVFLVPYNLAAGGMGGVSLIINHYTGWPMGTLYLILNVPLLAIGFKDLGRWPFVWRTLRVTIRFSR